MTVLELLAYAGDHLSLLPGRGRQRGLPGDRPAARLGPAPRPPRRLPHARRSVRAHPGLRPPEARARAARRHGRRPSPAARPGSVSPIGREHPRAVIAAGEAAGRRCDAADAVFETFTARRASTPAERDRDPRLGRRRLASCHAAPRRPTCADDLTQVLEQGDLLLFEEVADPGTGDDDAGRPAHRQVVRLDVGRRRPRQPRRRSTSPGSPGTRPIGLTFSLAIGHGAATASSLSVARGNLLLADHGTTVSETGRAADPIATGNRAHAVHARSRVRWRSGRRTPDRRTGGAPRPRRPARRGAPGARVRSACGPTWKPVADAAAVRCVRRATSSSRPATTGERCCVSATTCSAWVPTRTRRSTSTTASGSAWRATSAPKRSSHVLERGTSTPTLADVVAQSATRCRRGAGSSRRAWPRVQRSTRRPRSGRARTAPSPRPTTPR